jgi:anaerobic magnesium-protoporphyrin IX monomethyl ester cyclase
MKTSNHWIALVGPELEENLGLRYLSSSLRNAGFATSILPFNLGQDLNRVLTGIRSAQQPPLLIAISLSFQRRATDCMALILALRETGYAGHITGGGHFGFFCRTDLLRDFGELDSICCGEAEEIIVDLARSVRDQLPLADIAGLCYRDANNNIVDNPLRPAPDISSLPWPDRQGERCTCCGHRIAALVAGRGCYGNCAFCCIAAWHRSNCANRPFRIRPVDDVADEIAWLYHEQGIEIFIFHDDNFFLPDKTDNLERLRALAGAIECRGVGRIATSVKARPTDITPEVVGIMKERLGLYRIFLGVENNSSQGLTTLRRGVMRGQNYNSMKMLMAHELFICFNLLLFDPDTTPETLLENMDFISRFGSAAFFFGRVELYAGTPLLARMQKENRCFGDYLGWDYRLKNDRIQRIFNITMQTFYNRNYPADSPVNRLQSTRHDVEICRFFHPERYKEQWMRAVNTLCKLLADDTVSRMKTIVDFVVGKGPEHDSEALVREISKEMYSLESSISLGAEQLRQEVHAAVGAPCLHAQPFSQTLNIAEPFENHIPITESTRKKLAI